MQGKTCLVTGGAGFIGSHLCESLVESGYRVIVLDNLMTGRIENVARDVEFINHDVSLAYPDSVGHVDYVFHLASPASVPDYQKYPLETALVNSVGTRIALEYAKKYKAQFLFASTSEIYGDPLEHPQKESYWGNVNPTGVRSCYDESKRFGETLTMIYRREFKVDARIIRIFNTYGPRMRPDDGRVVSNFINKAIRNQPMTIYGKGSQTRSFCFVSDLVDGIQRAMFSEKTNGDIFNLGNPEERTVENLAKIVGKLIGAVSIEHKDLPEDDPQRRKPDISKARSILGWEPKVSIEDGLERTIAYYRSIM